MVRKFTGRGGLHLPIKPLQQSVVGHQDRPQSRRQTTQNIRVEAVSYHRDPIALRSRTAQPVECEFERRCEGLAVPTNRFSEVRRANLIRLQRNPSAMPAGEKTRSGSAALVKRIDDPETVDRLAVL